MLCSLDACRRRPKSPNGTNAAILILFLRTGKPFERKRNAPAAERDLATIYIRFALALAASPILASAIELPLIGIASVVAQDDR
jgi:hypothetical protein